MFILGHPVKRFGPGTVSVRYRFFFFNLLKFSSVHVNVSVFPFFYTPYDELKNGEKHTENLYKNNNDVNKMQYYENCYIYM